MQLKGHKTVRSAVTALAATLLGPGAVGASGTSGASSAAGTPSRDKIDSSLLIYSETGRVKLAEGVFDLSRRFSDGRFVGLRLTLDALTGASPNGATPSSRVQTFTSPSGNSSYVVQPGELPLDDTFKDYRAALDGGLRQSLDRITFLNVGGHLSFERDYTSLGVNGGIQRDFNRRNTSLGVSAAYSHDIVSPIGGAPVPLSSMPPSAEDDGEGEGDDDHEGGGEGSSKGKDVVDVVVGANQVIDRRTLLRLDYSLSWSSGYLNDPYKIVSVVQNQNSAEPGEPAQYLYEARPDTRFKQAIFAEARRYIAGSVLDVSYRYFWDDWGIRSNTVDVFLNLPVGGGHAIEPHLRWYQQSQADFHRNYLVDGQPIPTYASADSRLADFDAITYGLKYSLPVAAGARLSIAAEYYTQNGKRGPPDAIGILRDYDLFPKLEVFMIRIGFAHGL